MAANINRNIGFGDSFVAPRNQSTDEQISSPLQVFGQAKKQINSIFVEIQKYVTYAYERMIEVKNICPDVIDENELKSMSDYRFQVKRICEMLACDHMKVAFFGGVSNGKSTVVNAMLGEKVLPISLGDTTNCFLKVEGSKTGDEYFVTEGSNEKQDIESLNYLANALYCKRQLNEKELLHVYWPKDKCSLLRDDVALIDSPGFGFRTHLDDLIDVHYIGADVFVFVVNAVASISCFEKIFFHKLFMPNIFILFNHWDTAVALEPDMEPKNRQKMIGQGTDFLVKELKVCTPEEAVSRIFFISAKEVLQARVNERNGQALNSGAFAEGFSARYKEFEEFEKRLDECISRSLTKFLNHSKHGKQLLENVNKIMESVYKRSKELIDSKICQQTQSVKEFKDVENLYKEFKYLAKLNGKPKVFKKKVDFLRERLNRFDYTFYIYVMFSLFHV